ncbi:hypothetical protein Pelo_450 [Pelomyxa schiedti]|nr:hypothetical protein Pelo_450 [Pelomyxa schiedti]
MTGGGAPNEEGDALGAVVGQHVGVFLAFVGAEFVVASLVAWALRELAPVDVFESHNGDPPSPSPSPSPSSTSWRRGVGGEEFNWLRLHKITRAACGTLSNAFVGYIGIAAYFYGDAFWFNMSCTVSCALWLFDLMLVLPLRGMFTVCHHLTGTLLRLLSHTFIRYSVVPPSFCLGTQIWEVSTATSSVLLLIREAFQPTPKTTWILQLIAFSVQRLIRIFSYVFLVYHLWVTIWLDLYPTLVSLAVPCLDVYDIINQVNTLRMTASTLATPNTHNKDH